MDGAGSSGSRRGAQAPTPGSHPYPTEVAQRELEEARARATQMEKTMRWWSDCTANWREKWSKVRSERNKAREEVRILRGRLEVAQREAGAIRREKTDLESQIAQIAQAHMQNKKEEKTGKGSPSTDQANHGDSDSPERDGSSSHNSRNLKQTKAEKLTTDELHFIRDSKNTNFSLLEEMFGARAAEELSQAISGGVENVSVYSHKAADATRLSEKCRAGREVKDLICDEYLKDGAEKDVPQDCKPQPQRENDVEEKLEALHEQSGLGEGGGGVGVAVTGNSSTSSSQPSPSHRISTMSDPLPETAACHVNSRMSAVSDPLSEVCGGSECSESAYEESVQSVQSQPSTDAGVNSFREVRDRGPRLHSNGGGTTSFLGLEEANISPEQESLEQQVTMLKLRLDQATKTIQAERDEKLGLHRESSRFQGEAVELRQRLEELGASRKEAVKELVALRSQHQKEVQSLQLEMLDEAGTRESIDRRLADLRAELERLQEENAAEWGRRERLESEKLGMERDNKKLRAQVGDLEERLDKRTKMNTATPDADIAHLKQEIADKCKELSELKHAHNKLKKVLGDKSIEVQHCTRRADQYEGEVKRLRFRVDELKKELAASEDEVDAASNNIRKLQRSNDELTESVENLEVQVEHLQSRLRSSQSSVTLPLRLQDSDEDHAPF